MLTSKAIYLLKTFSEDEFREFGLIIKSPFYNKEKVLIDFYEILKKYYPSFEGRGFIKQRIFKKIYPGKAYNDGMMRNVLSKTLSLAEEYLAVKNFMSSRFNFNLSLMGELSDRKQDKLFNKAKESAESLMKKINARDESYYGSKFLIEDTERNFLLKHGSTGEGKKVEILAKMQESLASEFLIKIFKNAGYILNSRKKMYSQEINTNLLDKLEGYLIAEKNCFRDNIYIWYYFFIYKLAITQEEKYYFELRNILLKKYDSLNISDKRNIYIVLTNYCYIRTNKGEDKFLKEHFILLKENVEKGHYLTSGKYMSHIFYMNVIITGLSSGEKNWVRSFIDTFKEKLDEANRENSYVFGYALYYYHLKQFDEALKYASAIESNDLSYKHQLKSFYLKIYFDMNEAETFYSHVDSYRHFISSDKNTSKEMGKAIGNYITFTRQLFNIKNTFGKKDFELKKLKEEISENHNLINKQWLLSRVAEIEKVISN